LEDKYKKRHITPFRLPAEPAPALVVSGHRRMKRYKIVIWSALLIFTIGIVGEIKAINYLYHGLIVAPLVFTIGIFMWIPKRIKSPILHPYSPKEYKSVADAVIAYLFNNFLLEFWAGWSYLLVIGVLAGKLLFSQSEGFKSAKILMNQDETVKSEFGEITGIGHLISGSVSDQKASFFLTVFGSLKNGDIQIEVEKSQSEWELKKMKLN
jgi:hypothetical protein